MIDSSTPGTNISRLPISNGSDLLPGNSWRSSGGWTSHIHSAVVGKAKGRKHIQIALAQNGPQCGS